MDLPVEALQTNVNPLEQFWELLRVKRLQLNDSSVLTIGGDPTGEFDSHGESLTVRFTRNAPLLTIRLPLLLSWLPRKLTILKLTITPTQFQFTDQHGDVRRFTLP